MAGGFGPRFAVEAAFLLLLALFAGLADLRPLLIVAVVAAGWVIVALLELGFWQAEARAPTVVYAQPPLLDGEEAAEIPDESPEDLDAEPEPDADREGYPLRADAGVERAEEAEAYTTVLAEEAEPAVPAEPAAAERGE